MFQVDNFSTIKNGLKLSMNKIPLNNTMPTATAPQIYLAANRWLYWKSPNA